MRRLASLGMTVGSLGVMTVTIGVPCGDERREHLKVKHPKFKLRTWAPSHVSLDIKWCADLFRTDCGPPPCDL